MNANYLQWVLYVYGTSFYLKVGSKSNVERVFYLLTSIYKDLYHMITMYCLGCVFDEINELAEEIENK